MSAKESGRYFYGKEILADFQARWRSASRGKKSVPRDVPNSVGMPTIDPKSRAGKYFAEFASSSTLHGLNHLVAPNRHPVEIFLAVLFILGALLCLIFLSILFWDRYRDNATVIAVDNDREQFRIPKPAVFVCPVANVDEEKISGVFSKYGIEATPEAVQFFTFLATVAYENMTATPLFDKVSPDKWLGILYDLRKDISPNMLKENDPHETWTVTERGLCFATRNVFARYATLSYWTGDNGTGVTMPDKLSYYSRDSNGIEEYIGVEHEATISVCDPHEMITYGSPVRPLKLRMLQRATLSMSEIKTKPNVAELRIRQRKCKYLTDGGLKTWPVYARNACIIECRMRVIQDRCDCRPHFARPLDGIRTCDAKQLRCIGRIAGELFLYEYPPAFCECIPKCDVVSYQIRDSEKSDLNYTPLSLSVMTLIVEFPQVIYYRSLLYGFTDFLTGVGGAAGLFLGASVLSFVEILYYATLHACFYFKRRR